MMEKIKRKQIVISGGGPSGLAAALLFADRGWEDIIVVEQRSSAGDFEKNKAFNYQIDPRGQKLLKRLGIEAMLDEYGVANRGFVLTTIKPDGKAVTAKPPLIDPERETAYWATRRNFLEMLYHAVTERDDGRIRLLYGHSFKNLSQSLDERPQVTIANDAGEETIFEPDLLLACDGLNSRVRQSLQQWPTMAPDHFEMQRHPSPSTGLSYKVLNLPARFDVNADIGTVEDHRMTYAVVSNKKDRQDAMALFAFPVTDPSHPRSVNIIREADHNLWKIDKADALFTYLQDSFPQLHISEIVPRDEAEDFVALEPGRFPAPQYAKNIHAKLEAGGHVTHCLLIGDAAHAFPPDLGLGVNSALEDLYVFDGILTEVGEDLEQACQEYEARRLPENAALARLVQTVAPYQYNHVPWRLKTWITAFIVQLGLHKIMPRYMDKPTFMLTQDHRLGFVEIERRQKRSELRLQLSGILAIAVLVAAVFAVIS